MCRNFYALQLEKFLARNKTKKLLPLEDYQCPTTQKKHDNHPQLTFNSCCLKPTGHKKRSTKASPTAPVCFARAARQEQGQEAQPETLGQIKNKLPFSKYHLFSYSGSPARIFEPPRSTEVYVGQKQQSAFGVRWRVQWWIVGRLLGHCVAGKRDWRQVPERAEGFEGAGDDCGDRNGDGCGEREFTCQSAIVLWK